MKRRDRAAKLWARAERLKRINCIVVFLSLAICQALVFGIIVTNSDFQSQFIFACHQGQVSGGLSGLANELYFATGKHLGWTIRRWQNGLFFGVNKRFPSGNEIFSCNRAGVFDGSNKSERYGFISSGFTQNWPSVLVKTQMMDFYHADAYGGNVGGDEGLTHYTPLHCGHSSIDETCQKDSHREYGDNSIGVFGFFQVGPPSFHKFQRVFHLSLLLSAIFGLILMIVGIMSMQMGTAYKHCIRGAALLLSGWLIAFSSIVAFSTH